MKTPLIACLTLLATLVLGLLPGPARAEPIYNCTEGCYVVTCTGDVCTIWRCDPQGCRKIATDPHLQPKRTSRKPVRALPLDDVAFVRICPTGERCRVFELTAHAAIALGSFDNLDDLVDYRRSLHAASGQVRDKNAGQP